MEDHDAGGKVRLQMPETVISEAVYSDCRQYRYILHRRWEPNTPDRSLMFIMLNPSTATEEVDDSVPEKPHASEPPPSTESPPSEEIV